MDAIAQFFHAIPIDLLIIQTVNGVVTGMILALVASGLTLIFGIIHARRLSRLRGVRKHR
jgi:hypothetical protein